MFRKLSFDRRNRWARVSARVLYDFRAGTLINAQVEELDVLTVPDEGDVNSPLLPLLDRFLDWVAQFDARATTIEVSIRVSDLELYQVIGAHFSLLAGRGYTVRVHNENEGVTAKEVSRPIVLPTFESIERFLIAATATILTMSVLVEMLLIKTGPVVEKLSGLGANL